MAPSLVDHLEHTAQLVDARHQLLLVRARIVLGADALLDALDHAFRKGLQRPDAVV